jgi:SOS-response transcriptional repressor LexA
MSEYQLIAKRVEYVINYYKLSISAFEKLVGITKNSLNNLIKNEAGIGVDKIAKIITCYPELNAEWLMTGEGKMLKQLQIDLPRPNVCFVNQPVFAGDSRSIVEIDEQHEWIYIPGLVFGKKYYGLKVEGHSMQPTILEGDYVICEEIRDGVKGVKNNMVCIVVKNGESAVVKRVSFEDKNDLQLISDNKAFDTINIPYKCDEIVRFFKVTHRINKMNEDL